MQGMVLLTASAWLPGLTPGPEDGTAKWWQGAMLFGALYVVALGTGGTPQETCSPASVGGCCAPDCARCMARRLGCRLPGMPILWIRTHGAHCCCEGSLKLDGLRMQVSSRM